MNIKYIMNILNNCKIYAITSGISFVFGLYFYVKHIEYRYDFEINKIKQDTSKTNDELELKIINIHNTLSKLLDRISELEQENIESLSELTFNDFSQNDYNNNTDNDTQNIDYTHINMDELCEETSCFKHSINSKSGFTETNKSENRPRSRSRSVSWGSLTKKMLFG